MTENNIEETINFIKTIRDNVISQIPSGINARVRNNSDNNDKYIEIIITKENLLTDQRDRFLRIIHSGKLLEFCQLLPPYISRVCSDTCSIIIQDTTATPNKNRDHTQQYQFQVTTKYCNTYNCEIPSKTHGKIHTSIPWISSPHISHDRFLVYICEPYVKDDIDLVSNQMYKIGQVEHFGEASTNARRPVPCIFDIKTKRFGMIPGIPDDYGVAQAIIKSMTEVENVLIMEFWMIIVSCKIGRLGMCYYTSRPSQIMKLNIKWNLTTHELTFINEPTISSKIISCSSDTSSKITQLYRSPRWLVQIDSKMYCFSNIVCGEHWGPVDMLQVSDELDFKIILNTLWIPPSEIISQERNVNMKDNSILLPLIIDGKIESRIFDFNNDYNQKQRCQDLLPLHYGTCGYVQLTTMEVPARIIDSEQSYNILDSGSTPLGEKRLDQIYKVSEDGYVIKLRPQCKRHDVPQRIAMFIHGGPNSVVTAPLPAICYLMMECLNLDVMLCPNYPGSIGYSVEHWESLAGHIGTKDVKFCRDVLVKEIINGSGLSLNEQSSDEEVISAHRKKWGFFPSVLVYGGSHGGFLGAHLIGQHPNMYHIAILRNPVIDISCGQTDIPDWATYQCDGITIYDKTSSSQYESKTQIELRRKQWDCSPLRYAENVTAAVSIAVGEKDLRVSPSHGKQYYYALKDLGNIPQLALELYVYPESNHSLSEPKVMAHRDINMILFALDQFKAKETWANKPTIWKPECLAAQH